MGDSIERDDSTGRGRRLGLGWLKIDKVVNIKVWNTQTPRIDAYPDLVVRVTPQELADDLNALQIPGLRVDYRPPVEVPTKVGAIVADGDNYYVRVEGPRVSRNQRPWRLAGRSYWATDRDIGEMLNRGQGIRATIASEGVDL